MNATKSESVDLSSGGLEHWMNCGELLGHQVPSPSMWTPELRLAGAVLASALTEVRDHGSDRAYRRRVQQDLEWIASDDTEWPCSFVRLCQLFRLEPEWVRGVVAGWIAPGEARAAEHVRYRHAA